MSIHPSDSSLEKLNKILVKRLGRELSQTELEQAYYALMGFAEALIDLATPDIEPTPQPSKKPKRQLKHPIANNKESVIQYA